MDDSTFVALLGESLLAETPARREAGRILLGIARSVPSDRAGAELRAPDCGDTVWAEMACLADRFGLAELINPDRATVVHDALPSEQVASPARKSA